MGGGTKKASGGGHYQSSGKSGSGAVKTKGGKPQFSAPIKPQKGL